MWLKVWVISIDIKTIYITYHIRQAAIKEFCFVICISVFDTVNWLKMRNTTNDYYVYQLQQWSCLTDKFPWCNFIQGGGELVNCFQILPSQCHNLQLLQHTIIEYYLRAVNLWIVVEIRTDSHHFIPWFVLWIQTHNFLDWNTEHDNYLTNNKGSINELPSLGL